MQNLAFSSCCQTFTDPHIHGFAGVDFATSDLPALRAGLELLADRRTTQVTASLPSLPAAKLLQVLDRLAVLHAEDRIAGVHLEGPFLSPEYAGAHPPDTLLQPTSPAGRAFLAALWHRQRSQGLVSMMTIAPELHGFTSLVRELAERGIRPALGHTAADYDTMCEAIATVWEYTGKPVVMTHLYNAMRGFHHRDPGPLLAVLEAAEHGQVVVELIADGAHVDLAVVAWWLRHYPELVRFVSDASAATLPSGVVPINAGLPRLGEVPLEYAGVCGPRLADGVTLASGGMDLLAVHDALLDAGWDHDVFCARMR